MMRIHFRRARPGRITPQDVEIASRAGIWNEAFTIPCSILCGLAAVPPTAIRIVHSFHYLSLARKILVETTPLRTRKWFVVGVYRSRQTFQICACKLFRFIIVKFPLSL